MKEDPHVVGISEVELTATRSSGRPILTNETVGSFKLVTQPCYYNNTVSDTEDTGSHSWTSTGN